MAPLIGTKNALLSLAGTTFFLGNRDDDDDGNGNIPRQHAKIQRGHAGEFLP